MEYPTHGDARRNLQSIRNGKVRDEDTGRSVSLPKYQVEINIRDAVLDHLTARGEFFLNEGMSYYVDRANHRLYTVGPDGSGLRSLLADLNLEWKGQHTAAVASAIATRAGDQVFTPERPIHRLTYFDGKRSYIYQSPHSMIRISPDRIDEVPLGTGELELRKEGFRIPVPGVRPHGSVFVSECIFHATDYRTGVHVVYTT